jgi:hypothetical protein
VKKSLILRRLFLKIVGATIDIGKGEVKFNINVERSAFMFSPRFEVCDMINDKYVPPHFFFSKEEPKKKEEPEKKEVKIKEVVASVRIKEQKPPLKNKKLTKPKNKPVHKPKIVQRFDICSVILFGFYIDHKPMT